MKPTDISSPDYHHKVVDCQYACPAHTPVPEYIRLIHQHRYGDAYMVNWESNVFPGVLGRVCDRPCETACRRGRIDEEPVAICRLKRVAADMTEKQEIISQLPAIPEIKNGKTIALVGAGPASLTVARDLMPLGYSVHLYDEQLKAGGMMRSQIPSFRLPMSVLDDELGFILDMGVDTFFGKPVDSLKGLLDKDYDAIVVGTGAPRGRDLAKLDGRKEGDDNIHIGIEWLSSIAFEHIDTVGKRVLVLGGGNTAMDCCRSARRLGGEDVKIVVRSPYADMKASPWEKEDAMHEDIPIFDNHSPKEFVCDNGKLVGMNFEKVDAVYDDNGKRSLIPTGDVVFFECDDVIIAVGQENVFPWIEKDIGLEFGQWDMPVVDKVTYQSSLDKVFFAGDAAFGPENIITAVAQAHQAAISIDLLLNDKDLHNERPDPTVNLVSQKMGVHEWSYDSPVANDSRYVVPIEDKEKSLANRFVEVELGYSIEDAMQETQRCLNCDVQTVFYEDRCIECDSCMDICPTDCISFVEVAEEAELRQRLSAPATNLSQDLYVSELLPTKRAMVKDEDVCLHCGLCAERCPTTAWDMQKFLFKDSKAGGSCR